MTRQIFCAAIFSLCASALLLTGCATSFDPADGAPIPTSTGTISGTAFGGRQPISGAKVYLLQARSGGDAGPGIAATSGNASTDLLTSSAGNGTAGAYYVLTDANGKFTITGDYTTCTTGEQVYLYSVGGDAGGGANSSAGLMAVLGTCGSFAFTSSTTINMSEVSTIAAAYAMAGFATDATHVGYSGSSLAKTGITNAFANANQLFDVTSNPLNGTPNTLPRATTPNSGTNGGTGTVPQEQINTLADILAMCVDSSGVPFSQCTTLFGNGKSTLGATATDTATEAIYMAQNQHNTSVYNLVGAQPYNTYYSSAPNDLSIQLKFTGGGLPGTNDYDASQGMEADATGNIWVLNGASSTLSEFNHLGVPVLSSGYSSGLNQPVGIAIDASSSNIWIANYGATNVLKYSIGGNSTSAVTGAAISGPSSLALDASGNLWVTDYNNESLYKITTSNNSVGSGITGNGIYAPFANAIGTNGYNWVANDNGGGGLDSISLFSGTGAPLAAAYPTINSNSFYQAVGVRVDSANNAWFLIQNNAYLVKATYSGTLSLSNYSWTGNGLDDPISLVIDGNDNMWVASHQLNSADSVSNNVIVEVAANGTVMTGSGSTSGYAPSPTSAKPNSLTVDSSGNVWYNSETDATLRELIGAAAPVDVPLAHAVANSKLGQRP